MRLNKFLAQQGYATRRSADTLIEKRRVFVNGKVATLGQKVVETDRVEIKDFDTTHFRYILYYKPRGVITHSPAKGEVDIETRIQKDHSITGVFPIGRLDKDSEGLILLTNDGRITDRILNPEKAHEREYEVTVDKKVNKFLINNLSRGVSIEGYVTKPASASAHPKNDRVFTITLTEGKKHQVRRMCAALGYQVQSLKRTRMLDFKLKNLRPGAFYELKPREIEYFMKQLEIQ